MSKEEALHFLEEETPDSKETQKPWKLLIVDDDPGVHAVTKLALSHLVFAGRAIEFISAFSSVEARQIIAFHPDAAVVLLDVVMESEEAGLELVRFIRDDLQNSAVRIILRTGQPGQVPEAKVVIDYDINDYKTKTELTSQRLFTAVITALRGFRDIHEIHATKRGLEQVAHATTQLLRCPDRSAFARQALEQLALLLHLERNTHYTDAPGFMAILEGSDFILEAGTGSFSQDAAKPLAQVDNAKIQASVKAALAAQTSLLDGQWVVLVLESARVAPCLLVMESPRALAGWQRSVLEIFAANMTALCANLSCRLPAS